MTTVDWDYSNFRDLVQPAGSDPEVATELERLMRAGAPLADLLALLPLARAREHQAGRWRH